MSVKCNGWVDLVIFKRRLQEPHQRRFFEPESG